jgi:hypothetical protein
MAVGVDVMGLRMDDVLDVTFVRVRCPVVLINECYM